MQAAGVVEPVGVFLKQYVMNSIDGKVVLDRKEAAKFLSLSVRFVDQLASNGQLKRIKIGSKTLFRVSDLHQLISQHVCEETPNQKPKKTTQDDEE